MDRVLIVDDERGVRESLQAILADEGLEADAVGSGEQCLEALDRQEYGAVLLDVWLPRLDGLEVLRAIRPGPGRPAVIMISGHGSIDTAVRATKMGAFDFLEKPLSLERVVLVVRNALRQRRLEVHNRLLRLQVVGEPRVLGDSQAAGALRREVAAAAAAAGPILIRGERGAGKALVARAIHAGSPRAEEPFVELHCAGFAPDQLEGELFGAAAHPGEARGRLDLAEAGSLLLLDVERLPAEAQTRLAAVLQEGSMAPAGTEAPAAVQARLMATTRADLAAEVRRGGFREDLLGRLAETSVMVPPLRERREDIPILAAHCLEELRFAYGIGPSRFHPDALEALQNHAWPGNVRELHNLVERLVILAPGEQVTRSDLPAQLGGLGGGDDPLAPGRTLREGREAFERQFILHRLREHDHNVARTALALGIERSHLYRKIRALGLDS